MASEPPSASMHRPRVAAVLAGNAVPLGGVLLLSWSAATLLVLFWAENVIAAVANSMLIAVHQRRTRKRGHFSAQLTNEIRTRSDPRPPRPQGTFLAGYAFTAAIFALGHGLFLGLGLFVVARDYPDVNLRLDPGDLGWGVLGLAAVYAGELVVELKRVAELSFAAVKERANRYIIRMAALHITVIFLVALLVQLRSAVAPFALLVVLKAGFELLQLWGTGKRPDPERPPGFIKVLAQVGGKDAATLWREVCEEQERAEADDELPAEVE